MRGTKRCSLLFVFAMVLVMMSTTVQAASRIAFATDREDADFDNYIMKDDGSDQTEFAGETYAERRPSYSLDGKYIVYDDGLDLLLRGTSGSPSPVNLTDVLFGKCQSPNICEDADAGPLVNDDDFLIVFTRETTQDTTGEIILATVDVSAGTLTDVNTVVSEANVINYHPAWCGDDRIVWSREIGCGTCGFDPLYWWELCFIEVDEDGPIGTKTCYLGTGSHLRANQHPSCNTAGTYVAFAQSLGDIKDSEGIYEEQAHQICTMSVGPLEPDPEGSVDCYDGFDSGNDYDENKPVWSTGGTQIAFASDKAVLGSTDYNIWKVNWDWTGNEVRLTTDEDDDDEPDWGPALLP